MLVPENTYDGNLRLRPRARNLENNQNLSKPFKTLSRNTLNPKPPGSLSNYPTRDAFLDAPNTSFLRKKIEFRIFLRLPASKRTLCSLVKRVLGCLDAAL